MNSEIEELECIEKLMSITLEMIETQLDYTCSSTRTNRSRDLFFKLPLMLSSYLSVMRSVHLNTMDENSAVSIARNVIELRNAFHYLSEYHLTQDEINFRAFVADYHDFSRRAKIMRGLNQIDENTELLVCFLLGLVHQTDFYKKLSEKKQEYIDKGNKPYHFEFMKKRTYLLNKTIESSVYDLFSNHAHSFPLSNLSQKISRSESIFSYNSLLKLSAKIVLLYGSSLVKEYYTIRRNIFRSISRKYDDDIKKFMSVNNVLTFLKEMNMPKK